MDRDTIETTETTLDRISVFSAMLWLMLPIKAVGTWRAPHRGTRWRAIADFQ